MRILFAEIPPEGLHLEINDVSWFPDGEIPRSGPVQVLLDLKKSAEKRVLLSGELQTVVSLSCDRCLEPFEKEISEKFQVDLELVDTVSQEPVEHSCSVDEMDTVYLTKPELEVYEILKQQIFLFVSGKQVCNESCLGLCPQCGVNRNVKKCDCRQDGKSSPFQVLADMKRG